MCGIRTEQILRDHDAGRIRPGYHVTFVTEATATSPIAQRDAPTGQTVEQLLADPRTPPASMPGEMAREPLTPQETQVARPAREGLSNPEIATRLFITLAVADLDCARAFYRDGLGFQTEGLIGTEFAGNQTVPGGTTAVFHLDGRLMLSIYPRSELAKDALVPLTAAKPGEFGMGHVVASQPEVGEVIAQAQAAGPTVTDPPHDRPWGIYSGYFQDPDGHLWEVIWNPALDLASS